MKYLRHVWRVYLWSAYGAIIGAAIGGVQAMRGEE